MDQQNPKTPKNDNEEVRGDPLRDLPGWPEEFKEYLVDDGVPEHRHASSSSHELPSEPRGKVVSGKHSSSLTSRRTEIAVSACEPRLQGLLAEDAQYSRAQSGKCW